MVTINTIACFLIILLHLTPFSVLQAHLRDIIQQNSLYLIKDTTFKGFIKGNAPETTMSMLRLKDKDFAVLFRKLCYSF